MQFGFHMAEIKSNFRSCSPKQSAPRMCSFNTNNITNGPCLSCLSFSESLSLRLSLLSPVIDSLTILCARPGSAPPAPVMKPAPAVPITGMLQLIGAGQNAAPSAGQVEAAPAEEERPK